MPWRSRRAKAPQRKPNSPSAGIGTVSTPPPQQQDTLPPRIGVSTIQTERRHPPPLAQYSTQVGLADSCSLSPVRNDLRWLTISPDIAVVSHGGEGWGEGTKKPPHQRCVEQSAPWEGRATARGGPARHRSQPRGGCQREREERVSTKRRPLQNRSDPQRIHQSRALPAQRQTGKETGIDAHRIRDKIARIGSSFSERSTAPPFGAWLSLVERCVRDAEVARSNRVAPTKENAGQNAFPLSGQNPPVTNL